MPANNVHLEKPPSMTLEEFQEIVAIAASKKRLVQMGYMWRHNPGLIAALEAAGKGWLGDVLSGAGGNQQASERR